MSARPKVIHTNKRPRSDLTADGSSGWHNRQTAGWVYFFRSAGLIKIGWSVDPLRRFREVSVHSAPKVEFIGAIIGFLRTEKVLHREFHALRAHDEWFNEGPELLKYIEQRIEAGLMYLESEFLSAKEAAE